MSEAKPTKGEWVFCDDGDWTISVNGESVMGDATHYPWVPSNKADWLLICDAGNTYNTTGLTPSQLVERVMELEGALRNFTDGCSLSVDAGQLPAPPYPRPVPTQQKGLGSWQAMTRCLSSGGQITCQKPLNQKHGPNGARCGRISRSHPHDPLPSATPHWLRTHHGGRNRFYELADRLSAKPNRVHDDRD